jgi:transposase-like protein
MRENQNSDKNTSGETPNLLSMSLLAILRQGSGLLLKEAIEAEITEHLGRLRYQHGTEFRGHRNGYQKTSMDTPVGPIEYDRPKVAHAEGFQSRYHTPHVRRPEEFSAAVADMYVGGVSTRKVKDALKAVAGEKIRLSKSTVSRITKRVREEFKVWQKRSLAELDVAYLFLDAIRVGMRMGGTGKDAVLVAYAILQDGSMELLAVDLGATESDRSWGNFVGGLKMRGLKDPLLACSDGNAGVINAIDSHFATSYRQRCLKHRSENILDAVPSEHQDRVWKLLQPIFYGASSLEQAKGFVKKFQAAFRREFPAAVSRLEADLDQCLSFYLFPAHHWKRMRTSNKLERLNREIRRRLGVIGRHPDELGCLSLIYAVTKKYAATQRKFRVGDLERQLWKKLRERKIEMIEQLSLDLYAA